MSEPCLGCSAVIDCGPFGGIVSDVAPSSGIFATQGYTFLLDCPRGYYCFPGIFPRVINIDQRRVPPVIVNPNSTVLRLQGCQNVITRTIPVGATFAQIEAIAAQMQAAWAAQQAICDNLTIFPPPRRIENTSTILIGPLASNFACPNSAYDQTIVFSGGVGPYTNNIVSGSLPPGISPASTPQGFLLLSGTPTTPGTYQFRVRGTDSHGAFNEKDFVIYILGATNLMALPNATENTAYAQQINVVGNQGTVVVTLASGTLPGMTISPSGLISGTPDYVTAGDYPFTVSLFDPLTGGSCIQAGTLHIDLRPGPDWTQLIWSSYPLQSTPPISHCTGAGVKNIATAALDKTGGDSNPGQAPLIRGAAAGGFTYTGSGANCRIRIVVSAGSGFNSHLSRIFRNGVQISGSNLVNTVPGTYTFDFAFPASVGATVALDDGSPGNSWASVFGIGTPGTLSFSWAIFNL